MRWSYKTVHFSLKKEGLLGSAFIDEDEIEVSLNEYGKLGWELVSFMEVNDGLIAVFKQPFSQGLPVLNEQQTELTEEVVKEPEVPSLESEQLSEQLSEQNTESLPPVDPAPLTQVVATQVDSGEISPISFMESIPDAPHGRNDSEEASDTDVGAIRIL
jgi:hypothetical protein